MSLVAGTGSLGIVVQSGDGNGGVHVPRRGGGRAHGKGDLGAILGDIQLEALAIGIFILSSGISCRLKFFRDGLGDLIASELISRFCGTESDGLTKYSHAHSTVCGSNALVVGQVQLKYTGLGLVAQLSVLNILELCFQVRIIHALDRSIKRTVQQLDAVEVGAVGDTVDFGLELIDFLLEVGTVNVVVISAVGGLGGQVDHAVEHVLDFLHSTFSGLHQGDAVLDVLGSGVQTGDLCAHLLGNGQTGGVVTGAVDLVAGRQLLQVLGDGGGVDVVVAVGVHRRNVVLNTHFIASFQ